MANAFSYGGINAKYDTSQQYCLNGASGTIYFNNSGSLVLRGQSAIKTPMKTPVKTFENSSNNPYLLIASN